MSSIADKADKVAKEASGAYVGSTMDLAASAADFFATLRPQFYGEIIRRILKGENPETVYKDALDKFKKVSEGQKENIGKALDLPVKEGGKDLPAETTKNIRLAGSGMAGAITLPAAVVGAVSNILADKVAPNSEVGRFFANLGLNVGIPALISGGRHIVSGGAAKPLPKPVDNVRMTRGEQTNSGKLLTQENILGRTESQTDKVAAWRQGRAADAQESVTSFLGRPYEDALSAHKLTGEAEYAAAHAASGNRRFLRTDNLRSMLDDLILQNEVVAGTSTQKAKAAALKRLKEDLIQNPRITSHEAQQLLKEYGRAAYGKGQLLTDVAPGDAVGEAKALGGALKADLEAAATAQGTLAPRYVKSAELLLKANENYRNRVGPLKAYQDWMDAGTNYRASAREPQFDLTKTYAAIRKDLAEKPDLLEQLYPGDKAAQQTFMSKVEQLGRTLSDENIAQGGHVAELGAGAIAQGVSGVPGSGRGAMAFFEGVKMGFKNKDVVFNYLFNPKYTPDSFIGKVLQTAPIRYPAKMLERGLNAEVSNAVPQAVLHTPKPEEEDPYSPDKLFPDAVPNAPGQEVVPPTEPQSQDDTEDPYSPNAILARKVQGAESAGDPYAVNPASGARGASQFMPGTAQSYGLTNPYDKDASLNATKRMLDDLSKEFGGDLDKMLAGYNWGSGNVKKHGMDKMPKETKDYIARIRKELEKSLEDDKATQVRILSTYNK